MANQQLVDYIKSQLQMGVPKEALRNTLRQSGWPEEEVAAAMDTASPPAGGLGAAPTASKIGSTGVPGGITGSPVTSDIFQPNMSGPVFQPKQESAVKSLSSPAMPATHAVRSEPSRGRSFTWVLAVVAVGALAAAGVIYAKMSGPASRANALSAENAALSAKVAALEGEKGELTAQVTSFQNELQATLTDLSIVFPRATTSTQPIAIAIRGMVRGDDKTGYTLTTTRGVTVSVKNSRDAKVSAALKPLIEIETELVGTRSPASHEITVTSVNGVVIQ